MTTIHTLLTQLDVQVAAVQVTQALLKAEVLRGEVAQHRIYPDGHTFIWRYYSVTIASAMGAIDASGRLQIAYGVYHNGEPFDTVPEQHVEP